jgi:hypothetical protein
MAGLLKSVVAKRTGKSETEKARELFIEKTSGSFYTLFIRRYCNGGIRHRS